ncbi:MAG: hypothetical protein FWF05_07390 [Oscillospiraceae bacterium]|nr:hypothetical protein [Oscillospiraceae bacterium]
MKKLSAILLIAAILLTAACTKNTDGAETENAPRFTPIADSERSALFTYFYMTEWAILRAYPPEGFDPEKMPDEQTYTDGEGRERTWAYYISRLTSKSYNQMAAVYADALASEYYPERSRLAELDSQIAEIKQAGTMNFGSVDAFLLAMFGPGFTEAHLEKALTVEMFVKYYSSFWLLPMYSNRHARTDAPTAPDTSAESTESYEDLLYRLSEADIMAYYEKLASEYAPKLFPEDKPALDGEKAALKVIRETLAATS